jgi:putative redox protein
LLAASLASCMASDVVDILVKGRLPLRGLTAHLDAQRAAEQPRRLLAVKLHFVVTGDVPDDRVERAIALSHDKYCTVWHSLRQDIAFSTSFEVKRPA